MALQLVAAVGAKKFPRVKNISKDVKFVQALLKRSSVLLNDDRFAPDKVNGRLDDSTEAAILSFQQHYLKLSSPDGVVDKIPKSTNTLGKLIATAMVVSALRIRIKRTDQQTRSILGEMYVDGKFICYTLELPWKQNRKDESCVPGGTYDAFLRYTSNKRKREWCVQLRNVPNREAIQIHIGNTPGDIDGCTLVGMKKGNNSVERSTTAFQLLQDSIFGEGFTRAQIRAAAPPHQTVKVTYDYDERRSWNLATDEMLA